MEFSKLNETLLTDPMNMEAQDGTNEGDSSEYVNKTEEPAFYNVGGFKFLTWMEKKFNCAGFCEVPLFYVT